MNSTMTIGELLVHNAIYIIRGRVGRSKPEVLYVGKAGKQSVTDRLRMHIICSHQKRKTKIAKLISENGDSFCDWTVEVLLRDQWKEHGESLDSAEKALIQKHGPRCNRQHMKKNANRAI